jgi:hypothetical protein
VCQHGWLLLLAKRRSEADALYVLLGVIRSTAAQKRRSEADDLYVLSGFYMLFL